MDDNSNSNIISTTNSSSNSNYNNSNNNVSIIRNFNENTNTTTTTTTSFSNNINNNNNNINEQDKLILSLKPILNESNISKLLENEDIKIDKKVITFLNFVTTKFTRSLMLEIVESKYFEKSRNNYSYRNKSVNAKFVLETFYSLSEFENISKDMKLGEVSPTLEPLYERVIKNIHTKREIGSTRHYQANKHLLKDDDDDDDIENDDDQNEDNNNINPLLYNNIDNNNNFLKKYINPDMVANQQQQQQHNKKKSSGKK